MSRIVPPLCMLLALAMVIVGFGLWVVGPPEPNIDLHRARVTGDASYEEVLESQLCRRQQHRKWLLICLFAGSGLFTVLALISMRGAESGHE
ncbi:MAG: hypothetical protein JW829_02800 [Pirellulales bacterium]|nr:hypothetical protein [Pirellulales bacterium]